jgi:hypothetical protein
MVGTRWSADTPSDGVVVALPADAGLDSGVADATPGDAKETEPQADGFDAPVADAADSADGAADHLPEATDAADAAPASGLPPPSGELEGAGCGCRLPGREPTSATSWLAALALGAISIVLRRANRFPGAA